MIAPEGRVVIIPVFLMLCFFAFLSAVISNIVINGVLIFFFLFTIFCLYFFRDPKRKADIQQNRMLSPADGKIVQIIESTDKELGQVNIVSIFLSVFNVHRQWVPYDSKVLGYKYNQGAFFGALFNKASEKNEQSITYFETSLGNYKIKQIAGFIARRIINYMNPLEKVNAGDSLGFIRFGSRVDVVLPENFRISVSVGDKVKGCKTVLGKFNG